MEQPKRSNQDTLLMQFLNESRTFVGITFTGMYNIDMDDFFSMFKTYLKGGDNLLDDYTRITHFIWDHGRKDICYPDYEDKITFILNTKAVKFFDDKDIRNILDTLYAEKYRYANKNKTRSGSGCVAWRKKVLKRDNYTCQKCGSTEKPLHAHHIKSYKDYPKLRTKLDNGITLCSDCHKKEHKSKKQRG